MSKSGSILLGLFAVILLILIMNSNSAPRPMQRPMPYSSCQEYLVNSQSAPAVQVTQNAASDSDNVSYEQYMLSNGLEKSVIDSHRSYINSLNAQGMVTTGASSQTTTSHISFVNPTLGLRLQPEAVEVDDTAREVPTENDSNLAENVVTKYKYGFF